MKPVIFSLIVLALILGCGAPPADLVQIPLEFSQVHEVDTVPDNDTAHIDIRVYNPGHDSVWVPYDTNALTLWPVEYLRAYDRGDYLFGDEASLRSLGQGAPVPGFWLSPEGQRVLPEVFFYKSGSFVPRADSTAAEPQYATTDFQLNYGVDRKVQGRRTYYSQRNATPFHICARMLIKK